MKFLKSAIPFSFPSFRWNKSAAETSFGDLYALFRRSPRGKLILGEPEARALFRLVKKFAPKNIIDLGLGIGCSASIMALAGKSATITSVEQSETYVGIARDLIPRELRDGIVPFVSEVDVFKIESLSRYLYFSGYARLPCERGPFDLVVVDGPGPFLKDGEFIKLPNGDLINLLPHLAAGCKVFVDGRSKGVRVYKRYLSAYLKPLYKHQKYSIFERTAKRLDRIEDLDVVDRSYLGKESYFG